MEPKAHGEDWHSLISFEGKGERLETAPLHTCSQIAPEYSGFHSLAKLTKVVCHFTYRAVDREQANMF